MTVGEFFVLACQVLAVVWLIASLGYTYVIWAFRRDGVTAAEFSGVAKGLGILFLPEAQDLLTPVGVFIRNMYRWLSLAFFVSFVLSCSATYSG
ncbi:MAG: hypothetical protein COA62_11240 [Rhodobiaceae bacterium]|nr:MAG: hypothetical protein COA62_11240 [Rhodobiaceae bacterium]